MGYGHYFASYSEQLLLQHIATNESKYYFLSLSTFEPFSAWIEPRMRKYTYFQGTSSFVGPVETCHGVEIRSPALPVNSYHGVAAQAHITRRRHHLGTLIAPLTTKTAAEHHATLQGSTPGVATDFLNTFSLHAITELCSRFDNSIFLSRSSQD